MNTELDLNAATGNVNCSGNKFDFGTSAEDASGPKVLFKTHQNPIYVQSNIQGGGGKGVDGGLAHPKLFGDQAKREKRYSTSIQTSNRSSIQSLFKATLGKHLNCLESLQIFGEGVCTQTGGIGREIKVIQGFFRP